LPPTRRILKIFSSTPSGNSGENQTEKISGGVYLGKIDLIITVPFNRFIKLQDIFRRSIRWH